MSRSSKVWSGVIAALVGTAACGDSGRTYEKPDPSAGAGGGASGGAMGQGDEGGTGAGGGAGAGAVSTGGGGAGGEPASGSGAGAEGGMGEEPVTICTPNASLCDADRAVVCNADGTGYVGEGTRCTEEQACVDGACVSLECTPLAKFCAGKTVRQCAATGLSSEEVEVCPANHYCDADTAQCKPGVCAPNSPSCDGNRATTCNAAGSGYLAGGTTCSASESCESGKCEPHVCEPSQTFCQGQTVKTCAADGLSSTVVSTCTDQTCVQAGDTASCVGECAPGQSRCSANGVQSCGSKGQFGSAVACTNKTCVLSGSSAACVGECAPGQSRCSNNGVQSCGDKGQYGTAAACTNQTCVASGSTASCKGTCAPQQKVCSGNGTRTCNGAGDFGSVVACAANTPVCGGAGVCGAPPSCSNLGNTCGASGTASCCASSVVPGGTFNRSNQAGYPATVSSFRLDNYEVTVGRFRRFVAAYSPTINAAGAGKNPSDGQDTGWRSTWNSKLPADAAGLKALLKCTGEPHWTDTAGLVAAENKPINCITWYEANAFCTWDGGRMPTEAEWNYAAAGGSEQRPYAWGATPPGENATLAIMGCNNSPSGSCLPVAVGSVVAGNGRWGQSDLIGNIAEFVLDYYVDPYPTTSCNNCANHTQSFWKIYRGGYSGESDIPTMYRGSTDPEGRQSGLGVRCARAQ